MSLFKERASNAKLVIALRNEIINYKNQIKELSNATSSDVSSELDKLKAEHAQRMETLADLEGRLTKTKADIKKLKSENTRLKKKLQALETAQQEQE
tara:strand:+ start:649 stop:939 length:291 start_codon:yes stop_codon:yes gene_type:complete